MADPAPPQQGVPDRTASSTSTVTILSSDTQDGEIPILRLRLKKPKSDKKVQWTTETVDNEHMQKKKSKCCCIYEKPRNFDESSSSDSDEECEHCHGHVEKKKKRKTAPSDLPVDSLPDPLDNSIPNPSENHTDPSPDLDPQYPSLD